MEGLSCIRLEATQVPGGFSRMCRPGHWPAAGEACAPAPARSFPHLAGLPRGGRSAMTARRMPTDLPNLLTLSRIAAIPLLVALVALRTPGGDVAACAVFAAAAITDYFDGKIAR